MYLPFDLVIPQLGTYHLKKRSKTCTQMFMAYLFVVALNWKQLKYTLTNEWIDKLVSLQWNDSSQKKGMNY